MTDETTRGEQSRRDKELNLETAELSIGDKLKNDPENIKPVDAAHVQSREHRANGQVEKGGVASKAMAAADKGKDSKAAGKSSQ
jgi:hypothetical protein